jgi:hypothetical protein
MKPERFRFDHSTGSVYEYSLKHQAYVHCGKLNGQTEEQFAASYDSDRDPEDPAIYNYEED